MKRVWKKSAAFLLAALMLLFQINGIAAYAEEVQPAAGQASIVMTLGADLSPEQKAYVLQFFGVSEDQAKVVTITNADEQRELGGKISADRIGTHTLSCALIRLTTKGGIQVKVANMNYVTSNTIASQLSTSGVYNCEVLTAAPFEVSGTGALTGVMMAYEAATGQMLDENMKELANEELVTTGDIAETIGQDQATLVVNDIKIHIVRDGVTDQQAVNAVVDEVVETTYAAATAAASLTGTEAPAKLGEVETQKLYDFGYKYSQQGYDYNNVVTTLERVTRNVTKATGIDDPITDTFITPEETELDPDSILLGTDDASLGDGAIINATTTVALGEHEPESIDVFTGDVTLENGGTVKAGQFIPESNDVVYQDVNGKFALMDLNGNLLTDSAYMDDFDGDYGYITARYDDGADCPCGLFAEDGTIIAPFEYHKIDIISDKWAFALTGTATEGEEYDFSASIGQYDWAHMMVDHADVYYLDKEASKLVGTFTRDQIAGGYEAEGDYLNCQDINGTNTTYDSSLTPVGNPDSLYNFDGFDSTRAIAEAVENTTGYYVGSFYGGYAYFSDYNNSDGAKGIIDRYGNIIIPAQFRYFYTSFSWPFVYQSGGYFGAVQGDGTFCYVTAGGNVTGSFPYDWETYNIYNCGMSARVEKEDGSISVLSGDGKETDFGTTYEYFNTLRGSQGMFWVGQHSDYTYDLIDWHGNVLLSGSDGYSISANGNYLISNEGYTSSTLYLVNGASPVSLASSAGGAAELKIETKEGASLEQYSGTPVLEKVGTVNGRSFAGYSDLVMEEGDNGNYALSDLSGNTLTEYDFDSWAESENGWLIMTSLEGKKGLFSSDGRQALPCEFDVINVLGEKWAVGYTLKGGATEDDCDFKDYDGGFFYIDTAEVFHFSDSEITSVTLPRENISGAEAMGEYLNVEDRTSGNVTTYDATFTAVASAHGLYDFGAYDQDEVLAKQLSDQTGYSVDSRFEDGYARAADYSGEESKYGVVDMSGNLILPVQYDMIHSNYSFGSSHLWAFGYFCVSQGDMMGYVAGDGTVTCEPQYPEDSFYNYGISGYYKEEDDTYTLVAADGTVSKGHESLHCLGSGKLYIEYTGSQENLIDWHGEVLVEDIYSADVSADDQYLILQMDYSEPFELYTIDGAPKPEGQTALQAQTESSVQETEAEVQEKQTDPEPETAAAQDTAPTAETAAAPKADSGSTQQAGAGASSEAAILLSSAGTLLDGGLETNGAAISTILNQAKTSLEADNPEAAALVGSAAALIDAGSADVNSISTLLSTAQTMISG